MIPIITMGYLIGNAQSDKMKYYFVTKKDTVFCKKLRYDVTPAAHINEIDYTDMQGKQIVLKDKKNMPEVLTFHTDKETEDKIPIKPNQPKSYQRYTSRVVDGKLKVYLGTRGVLNGSTTGMYRFFIKMPDGKFYKINSGRNMKKVIKPYLIKCKEFNDKYKGNFKRDESSFMDMIGLYNSLCK